MLPESASTVPEKSLNLNASALCSNRDISDFPVGPDLLSAYQRSFQFSKSGLFPADTFLLVPVVLLGQLWIASHFADMQFLRYQMGQIKETCGQVRKGAHVTPLQISLTEFPFRRCSRISQNSVIQRRCSKECDRRP
jgi:hypothetical protein